VVVDARFVVATRSAACRGGSGRSREHAGLARTT
jgi:hypothetical protein